VSFERMLRKVLRTKEYEAAPPEARAPRVVALLPIYNSATTLTLTLDSLLPHVDRIVMFEGAYDDSPGTGVRSADRTLNIAYSYQRDFPSKVELYLQRARMTRQEKWNYLINLVLPGDLALLMDLDDVLLVFEERPFDKPRGETADYYLLDVVQYDAGSHAVRVHPSIKLIRKKPGLRFTGRRWVVAGARELVLGDPSVSPELLKQMGWYLPGAQVFRLDFLRPLVYRSPMRGTM
jgi:glycosyltransferase involved in cell wall biosynthesis